MPYKAFGVENRLPIPAAVKKAGTAYFGNKGFPGQYHNSAMFEAVQDHILGTESQTKTLGEASIWYDGSVFKDKDDATVVLVDYDRINIVIDTMERDIVFPDVKLEFIAHSLVDLNNYDMTVVGECVGRIELFDSERVGILNISGQSNALKTKRSGFLDFKATFTLSGITDIFTTEDFVFVARGSSGLFVYTYDDDGILTFADSDTTTGNYEGVTSDGTFIIASLDAVAGDIIKSFSISGLGVLTPVDDLTLTGTIQGSGNLWYGQGFIFLAANIQGLTSISIDGGGNLALVDTDNSVNVDRVYGDTNFIYTSSIAGGVSSYVINGGGFITFKDTENTKGASYGIFSDGTFLYSANNANGLSSYSVNPTTGAITLVDTDTQGSDLTRAVWGNNGNLYAIDIDTTNKVRRYVVNSSGIFKLLETSTDQTPNIDSPMYGNSKFLFTAQAGGVSSYANEYFINFTGLGTIIDGGELRTP